MSFGLPFRLIWCFRLSKPFVGGLWFAIIVKCLQCYQKSGQQGLNLPLRLGKPTCHLGHLARMGLSWGMACGVVQSGDA